VLTAGADGRAKVWETTAGRYVASLDHPGPVKMLAMSPDGRTALTACADQTVRLWDLGTRKLLRAMPHPCT
jgi:WD40 repeat protein